MVRANQILCGQHNVLKGHRRACVLDQRPFPRFNTGCNGVREGIVLER